MQSFHFSHIDAPAPATAHVAIVRGLANAEAILSDVKSGARQFGDTPMTLIDAKMITSSMHLHVAIHQALLRNARSFTAKDQTDVQSSSSMRTKSVHSEILWNLSTTNNIAETFRVFGLTASTTDLILIHAAVAAQDGGPSADKVAARMSEVCQGTIDQRGVASLDAWKSNADPSSNGENARDQPDWTAIIKAYRLNDLRATVGDDQLSSEELAQARKEKIDAMATSIVSMKFVSS